MTSGFLANSASAPLRVVRDHVAVARMALSQGDYHASMRNLSCAFNQLDNCKEEFSPAELAEIEHLSGKVYVELRMYEEAQRAFERAVNLRSGPDGSAVKMLSERRHLAECLRLNHRLAESEALYKECISVLKEISNTQLQIGKCYMGIAQVAIDDKDCRKADEAISRALGIFERNGGSKSYWYGRSLMTLARLRFVEDKLVEAEALLNQALEIVEPLVGPQHPLRARALRALGKLNDQEGHSEDGRQLMAKAQMIENFLRLHDR